MPIPDHPPEPDAATVSAIDGVTTDLRTVLLQLETSRLAAFRARENAESAYQTAMQLESYYGDSLSDLEEAMVGLHLFQRGVSEFLKQHGATP